MSWQEPRAAGHGYPVTGGEQGRMRAADADRDRAAGMLGIVLIAVGLAVSAGPHGSMPMHWAG